MRAKAHLWHDQIIVDHPQTPETHPIRVIIVRKAKSVIRVQPPMTGVAPLVCFSNFHHAERCHLNVALKKIEFLGSA